MSDQTWQAGGRLLGRALGLLVGCGVIAAVAAACGDGGKDDGNDGEVSGNGTGGGGIILDPDGGLVGQHDGGTVDLTPEQVEQIETSACAGWAGEGELLPAVLQLVVDVSGSMDDNAPGTRDSKWEVTHSALEEAIAALGPDTAVGILLYPNVPFNTGESWEPRPIDSCVAIDELLPIDLLGDANAAHRGDVLDVMDRAIVGGGTPTHDAFEYALEEGLLPYVTDLQRFMLLITDGQPTYSKDCLGDGMAEHAVDPQPIVDVVQRAHDDHGIRTFVIGSPGSESASETGEDMRGWLSEAAELGGTAAPDCQVDGPNYCHMDMTEAPDFSQALREGLSQVIGEIGQCTYALPVPPDGQVLDLQAVNLILHTSAGSKLVLPDNQGDCTEGWQFDADNNVVLCSTTCAEVEGDAVARVQLLFGCTSGEIPEIQ